MTRALVLLRSGLSRRSMLRQTAGIGVSAGLGGVGRASAQDATPGAFGLLYDVVYGSIGVEDLVMDIARPLGLSDPQPAVVLIHGGGRPTEATGSARREPHQCFRRSQYDRLFLYRSN